MRIPTKTELRKTCHRLPSSRARLSSRNLQTWGEAASLADLVRPRPSHGRVSRICCPKGTSTNPHCRHRPRGPILNVAPCVSLFTRGYPTGPSPPSSAFISPLLHFSLCWRWLADFQVWRNPICSNAFASWPSSPGDLGHPLGRRPQSWASLPTRPRISPQRDLECSVVPQDQCSFRLVLAPI